MPRSSKYTPELCDKLIEHMAQGMTYESFAATLSVSRNTLYVWERRHKPFKQAKDIGIEKSLFFWEKMGIAGTVGLPSTKINGETVKLRGFSAAMWIYNMKCRFRGNWLEDAPGDQNATIKLSYEPKTQRQRRTKNS